ncbi:hydroxyacid dehydrogenase [Paenibacillus xerothermodurans]|uniref:Hydroxyacid dehydrogenase n=1 Tax=Paenibacillus xerothermodurans TaxID=1977292 RepID=A0A2W1P0V5_PAEXE|nr:hydroxyacid dehydrogenase [Paenibacillus xerothermodurans]PZE20718.1 hydroxyacid dehydrogenase [Paenibacillus xerothermodurans]
MKPKVLVLPPQPLLDNICSARCRELLESEFTAVWNHTGQNFSEQQLAECVGGVDIVITSWGSPAITERLIDIGGDLYAIGHAAGSVKDMVPKSAFQKGIRVFSANSRMARTVAEYCLTAIMTLFRPLVRYDSEVRQGKWKPFSFRGRELGGSTVGIIAASAVALQFIKLLKPFGVQICLYDPYITEAEAASLGAVKCTLEEAMRCRIVSVHAPSLPATANLITKELLRLIPEGGVFLNSSRGAVVSEEGLTAELQTGRFQAVLDVYVEEPLPMDHPLRKLDNVLLTPHIGAETVEGQKDYMELILEDILRARRGEQTFYEVSERMWDMMGHPGPKRRS